jgi:hypothetical protein
MGPSVALLVGCAENKKQKKKNKKKEQKKGGGALDKIWGNSTHSLRT